MLVRDADGTGAGKDMVPAAATACRQLQRGEACRQPSQEVHWLRPKQVTVYKQGGKTQTNSAPAARDGLWHAGGVELAHVGAGARPRWRPPLGRHRLGACLQKGEQAEPCQSRQLSHMVLCPCRRSAC
jgi:hypothetical protein